MVFAWCEFRMEIFHSTLQMLSPPCLPRLDNYEEYFVWSRGCETRNAYKRRPFRRSSWRLPTDTNKHISTLKNHFLPRITSIMESSMNLIATDFEVHTSYEKPSTKTMTPLITVLCKKCKGIGTRPRRSPRKRPRASAAQACRKFVLVNWRFQVSLNLITFCSFLQSQNRC